MLRWLGELLERVESGRRRRVLLLLAARPLSEAELGRHFFLTVTLGWHLRELHALGLLAYNRRADRYHLVWPALEELVALCNALDAESEAAPAVAARAPRAAATS